MKRTIKIAEFIAKKEKANLEISRLGAMLHQLHDNLDELKEFLRKICLDPKFTKKLIECAEFRPVNKPYKRGVSTEAKIVFDADALQVLGPRGVIREIACNLGARNKSLNQSVHDARKVERKFHNALQTKTAKKMIEKPDKLMKDFWKIYDKLQPG